MNPTNTMQACAGRREAIPIPEYGHHVQHMVDHCKTIADRNRRNHCARTIIKTMALLHPEKLQKGNGDKILWDHLAIMARFELDIDYPVEVIQQEQLLGQPETLRYPESDIIYRHYGHTIQGLIAKACQMEEGPEREALSLFIANRMKYSYIMWNKRSVEDYTIFKDLFELSRGVLVLNEDQHQLHGNAAVPFARNNRKYTRPNRPNKNKQRRSNRRPNNRNKR